MTENPTTPTAPATDPMTDPAIDPTIDPGATVTLITGANKSLGFEAARRLLDAGHVVYVAARDVDRGQEAAQKLGARFVQLDVTSEESVIAAAAAVEREAGRLDVLVNNAGINGSGRMDVADVTAAEMAKVYETNVFGIVRVTHAFLPLLRRSARPVVVNVSSGLGSHAATSDPDRIESKIPVLAYGSSKAAVAMITSQYAAFVPEIRFNTVDPGYTATDFNGHSGPQTVTEGTDAIVELATIGPDGPTGGFFDRHGVVPW